MTGDAATGGTSGSDAVRARLQALALGKPPEPVEPTDPEALVEEAETALSSVRAAAAFAETDGFRRLRPVAAGAGGRTDDAVARRATAVLDALSRYRSAYRAVGGAADERPKPKDSGRPEGGRSVEDSEPVENGESVGYGERDGDGESAGSGPGGGGDAADHFHSAHDSHIPDGAVRGDNR
ncbi:hypothetical protein BRC97_04505 [Halobacteriales archaeon QS_6_71_20]|nr:MAG: hypothetical protein BRC97_04505 [Halobacteriales archaeon QS_6_71_20]